MKRYFIIFFTYKTYNTYNIETFGFRETDYFDVPLVKNIFGECKLVCDYMPSRSEIIVYISDSNNKLCGNPGNGDIFDHITGITELSEQDYNDYNK